MKTESLLLITNADEIEQAESLNMPKVQPKYEKRKMLFYKRDVVRAWVNEDNDIVILTSDESYFCMSYEEKIWKELEKQFTKNEK